MASDDWIQESLARLEGLEDERNKTEAALESATDPNELRTLSQRLEQLEGEIAGLYQSLEAAADGDDAGGMGDEPPTGDFVPAGSSEEDDFDADAPTGLFSRDDLASMAAAQGAQLPTSVPQPGQEQLPPQPVAQPQPMAQQPGFGAPAQPGFGAPAQQPGFGAPAQQPSFGAQPGFGAPAQQPSFGAQPGFGAPAQQPSFGGGGGMSADYADLDDDLQPKSKGPLIAIILAVLVLGGVGGYFAFAGGGGGGEEPVDAGPAGPAKVIKAGEVPPDTQGPKGAKGADVDSVEGSQFKEGSRPRSGGGGGGGGGGSSATKTKKKKVDPKTKIVETDDPLAGIDGG